MNKILAFLAILSLSACTTTTPAVTDASGKVVTPATTQPSVFGRLLSGIHLSLTFDANGQPTLGVTDSIQPTTTSGK